MRDVLKHAYPQDTKMNGFNIMNNIQGVPNQVTTNEISIDLEKTICSGMTTINILLS